MTHYENDSATAEWLLMSANLRHCESDVDLELKDGRWIIAGVAAVSSFKSACEVLTEAA